MKIITSILLIGLLLLVSAAWAGDDFNDSWAEDEVRQNDSEDWGEFEQQERLESPWQLGIGISVRQDKPDEVDAQPEFSLKVYHYPLDLLALTGEVGYTNSTSLGSGTSASVLQISFGLRAQGGKGLVSFFVEPALVLQRNDVESRYGGEHHSRFGVRASMGLSLRVSKHTHLDVGLRQSLNGMESRQYEIYTPPLPGDDDVPPMYPDYYGTSGFEDLFNPGYIYVRYRFGL